MTLRDMLRGRDVRRDPLSATELYAANMVSREEGARLQKQQKLDEWRARKAAERELYEDVRAMAEGREPPSRKRRRGNGSGAAAAAGQLGLQALGSPPLGGGIGDPGEGQGPKKC